MTKTKPWWQSKTIWAGVIMGLVGGYNIAAQQLGSPPIPAMAVEIIGMFFGGVAINGRAKADTKIGS